MLPKRKSALVLPVKRSSTESCSDILDLRAEHKKFKTHPDDVTSPAHSTNDVNSLSVSRRNNSRLSKNEGVSSSPPSNGSESHAFPEGTVRCCGGCSESFASFHQMFSHLNSTSHNNTTLNLSNAERPYFDDVSHPAASPDFDSFSSTPSALERLANSSMFQTISQNLPDLSNDKMHGTKSFEKAQSFSSDFQTAEDVTNEVASIKKIRVSRSSVVMNNNIDVSSSHSVESSLNLETLSSSNESEKLRKPSKGNKSNPWSTNQNLRQHHHYLSSGQSRPLLQQTQQNFLHNYLQSVFCQGYEVQNLMDLFYQNEFQKFMQQSCVDPKLFYLLSNQARFPWIQPAYRSSTFPFDASSRNFSANGSNFQNISRDQTNSVSGECNPRTIDSQPKSASFNWSEKAKSNVWLMMGHGNTCFACGRSFTSKGSFRYHLSRCHVLSGINTR